MTGEVYDNAGGTKLRMPEIKLYLYETAGKLLEANGFKFNKSKFTFTRRCKKNFEQFFFTFRNYLPLNYTTKFSLIIWNQEVQNILKTIPHQQENGSFNFCSIKISMGDFVEENIIRAQVKKWEGLLFDGNANHYLVSQHADKIKHLTTAQIDDFAYELHDSKDLFETSDAMTSLLQNQLLPLANQLSSINGIDAFFESRPGWSVNSLWLNNMATELVVAKLNKKQNFHKVYLQLIEIIEIRIENMGMNPEYRNTIEKLYRWLLNPGFGGDVILQAV